MSIRGLVNELLALEAEISANNARNKVMRNRLKIVKEEIQQYLISKEQVGMKFDGHVILLETKPKKVMKPKVDRKESMIEYFKSLGIADTEKAYQGLQEVQLKEETEVKKLKVRNQKKQQ